MREGEFTLENGEVRKVDMMHSEEYQYLEDDGTKGLLKYYADEKYAFAALLPEEGMTVGEYVSSLTGEKLHGILTQARREVVYASIPRFESEYSVEMGDILQAMGIRDAFDGELADFSSMGSCEEGKLHINRVLHKTYIAVDEKGTRAGASTVVEMVNESAPMDPKTVTLDRPFVYMIIDCDTNLPVFIGVVTDIT